MNLDQKPHPISNVIWRVLDDNAVLVSPQGGQVTILNGAGTTIWSLIDGQNSGLDIAHHLVQQYDVSIAQAQQDVEDFLAKLNNRGLITWGEENL
jgi:hypothetical protein